MLPSKCQASLGAEKNAAVDRGRDRTLGSDPQARRILDSSSAQRKRLAIINGVADVVFIAKDVVDHSSRPRSSTMIGNTFAIEPPYDLFFRLSGFDILPKYSPNHLDLFWEAYAQDDMVGLQVLLLAAFKIPL